MNKHTQKPPITVAKVAAGYGLNMGRRRVAIFDTKEEAVDAARGLARSGQGTLRAVPPGSPRSFGTTTKRVVRAQSGTTLRSKPRRDSSEASLKSNQPSGIRPTRDVEPTSRVTAAGADVTEQVLVRFMVQKEDLRRRKGVGAGAAAIAGLIGSAATAGASIMQAATTPGLDTTLLLGVLIGAALVATVLINVVPGVLKSRTKTNAWAAKVAGAVWDDEMAEPGGIKRLASEGGL